MGSVLSIDYGSKRIGIAFSDPKRIFAFPYGILENKDFNYICSQIKDIACEKEVDLIIVGVPYDQRVKNKNPESSKHPAQNGRGSLSKAERQHIDKSQKNNKPSMETIILEFISKLEKNINIPITTVDESYSSFMAEENLKNCNLSSKKSRKHIDTEAARLLLEEFIQKNN